MLGQVDDVAAARAASPCPPGAAPSAGCRSARDHRRSPTSSCKLVERLRSLPCRGLPDQTRPTRSLSCAPSRCPPRAQARFRQRRKIARRSRDGFEPRLEGKRQASTADNADRTGEFRRPLPSAGRAKRPPCPSAGDAAEPRPRGSRARRASPPWRRSANTGWCRRALRRCASRMVLPAIGSSPNQCGCVNFRSTKPTSAHFRPHSRPCQPSSKLPTVSRNKARFQ